MFDESSIFSFDPSHKSFVADFARIPVDCRFSHIFDQIESGLQGLNCFTFERSYDSLLLVRRPTLLSNLLSCRMRELSFFLLTLSVDMPRVQKKLKMVSSLTDSKNFKEVLERLQVVLKEIKPSLPHSSRQQLARQQEEVFSDTYHLYTSILSITRALYSLNYSVGKRHCEFLINFDTDLGFDFKTIAEFESFIFQLIVREYNSTKFESRWLLLNGSEVVDELYGQAIFDKICEKYSASLNLGKQSLLIKTEFNPEYVAVAKETILLFLSTKGLLQKIAVLEDLYFTVNFLIGLVASQDQYIHSRNLIKQAAMETGRMKEVRVHFQICLDFVGKAKIDFASDEFLLELLTSFDL